MLIKGGRLVGFFVLSSAVVASCTTRRAQRERYFAFVAEHSNASCEDIFIYTNQRGLIVEPPATPIVGEGSRPVKIDLYVTPLKGPPEDNSTLADASPTSEASVVLRTWTRGPLSDGEVQPQCKWLAGDVG